MASNQYRNDLLDQIAVNRCRCTVCKADAGEGCHTATGTTTYPHAARLRSALRQWRKPSGV